MKTPMLGLVAAAAACAASSLYLWHELDAERTQAAQVAETNRSLQARIAELEQARAQFAQRRMTGAAGFDGGSLGHGPPLPPESPGGAITAETVTESGAGRGAWHIEAPQRSAAFNKVMRAQMRANNRRFYADLGSELGLDKETSNKLIDLLSSQQVDSFGQFYLGMDPAEAEQKGAEMQRQNKAAIEDLIGPDKAQALEDYQQSMPARGEFDMLARQLEANDLPLTAEQAKKLRAAYVEERARVTVPAYDETHGVDDKYMKAVSAWQEDYNRRVGDAAAGILNNDQINAFNEFQQWQKEMSSGFSTVGVMGGGPAHGVATRGAATTFVPAAGTMTFVAPAPPPKANNTGKP